MLNIVQPLLCNPIKQFTVVNRFAFKFYMAHCSHDIGFNIYPLINGLTFYNLGNLGTDSPDSRLSVIYNDKVVNEIKFPLKAGEVSPLFILKDVDFSEMIDWYKEEKIWVVMDRNNTTANTGNHMGYKAMSGALIKCPYEDLGYIYTQGHSSGHTQGYKRFNYSYAYTIDEAKADELYDNIKNTKQIFYINPGYWNITKQSIDKNRDIADAGYVYANGNGRYDETNGNYIIKTNAYYFTYMSGNSNTLLKNNKLFFL